MGIMGSFITTFTFFSAVRRLIKSSVNMHIRVTETYSNRLIDELNLLAALKRMDVI